MALPSAAPTNPQHYKEVISNLDPKKLQSKFEFSAPVLGNKSYTAKYATQNQPYTNISGQNGINHSVVYSKKNSVQKDSSNIQTQQQLPGISEIEENTQMINLQTYQIQQQSHNNNYSLSSQGVEAVNVKLKDQTFQDFPNAGSSIQNSSAYNEGINHHLHLMDERRSVDKASNDSPSRLHMRSLMDHSQQDSIKKKGKNTTKAGSIKKNSNMKGNLKMTGKSIIESQNTINNLSMSIRSASKDGTTTNNRTLMYGSQKGQINPKIQVVIGSQNNSHLYTPQQQQLNSSAYIQDQQANTEQYLKAVLGSNSNERVSGYPKPDLYNQHYINKYSFPKGLQASRKPESMKKQNQKLSLYDMDTPALRKGIAGWKLTKRPIGIMFDPNMPNASDYQNSTMISDNQRNAKRGREAMHDQQAIEHIVDSDEERFQINNQNYDHAADTSATGTNVRRSIVHYQQNPLNQSQQDGQKLTNIKINYNAGSRKQLDNELQGSYDTQNFSGEGQLLSNMNENQMTKNITSNNKSQGKLVSILKSANDQQEQLQIQANSIEPHEHEVTTSFTNRNLQKQYQHDDKYNQSPQIPK
eukprot:403332242